jgi:tetratricopeptide (TPR) repeat protein
MRRSVILIGTIALVACAGPSRSDGQSAAKAKRLAEHGLSSEAKAEFIAVLLSTASNAADKAESLYQLGQLSFAEGRYKTALADWAELREKYPMSAQAKDMGERLAQLREVVQKGSDEQLTNAVASSYVRNGDFWSDAPDKFTIDASWLPRAELGIYWYDRVIKEYPGSDAAELANIRKLRTLLGWKEDTQYGSSYGVKANFGRYMPLTIQSFDEFAKTFPTNTSLQGFRFQIAQAYWREKDWTNTRLWLQRIVDEAKGEQTFYSELAKSRLAKVEY